MPSVTLTHFEPSRDLWILATWLHRPHVGRWWGDPDQALAAVSRLPVATQALIHLDARPVGYLCWQVAPQEELVQAGLGDLPEDLVDVDILIGETDAVGQGVGPDALSQLMARLRADGVRVVGLAAATANRRALRAFGKAGFRLFRLFHDSGQEMQYLVQTLDATV